MQKILNKIVDIQQFISNAFLIFIMTIITIDVLGRNLFNKPLKGTFEMTELGSALLVFFALAMTHRHGEHITIDFIVERLPERVRNILNGVVEILIAFVMFFMSGRIFENGLRMVERTTTTTDLALPIYPFLFIITFTLIIFALTAIYKSITYFRLAVNRK